MSYLEWSALGLILILFELFIPGVYLIWFGLASLAVSWGVYMVLIPDTLVSQLVAFSAFSCLAALAGMYLYKKAESHFKGVKDYKNLNDLAAQYVGQVATLTQDTVDGKSKVKVGDSVWLAVTDEELKAGEKVLITGVEKGLIFVVTKK